MRSPWSWVLIFGLVGGLSLAAPAPAEAPVRLRIATYNVENYLDAATDTRVAKPEASRQRVAQALHLLAADVVAFQEMGGADGLAELQRRLGRLGLNYPHSEIVGGYDTNTQVAVLSRYPIVARRSHADERFLLRGRRFQTTRGILEIDIKVSSAYRFTLMTVHLKSRRETGSAPQQEVREQEAQVLRRLIDARLREHPDANLVVLGDFNDTKDSLTFRTIRGRGRTALIDTRPAERNGDTLAAARPGQSPRNVAWTHFFEREDLYSRVDYILVSPGMAREWDPQDTYVLAFPNWGEASDHRPLVATFLARDR
jgi:endonuclease/exonuclease/phosphatase family metal-dependent hydrolase